MSTLKTEWEFSKDEYSNMVNHTRSYIPLWYFKLSWVDNILKYNPYMMRNISYGNPEINWREVIKCVICNYRIEIVSRMTDYIDKIMEIMNDCNIESYNTIKLNTTLKKTLETDDLNILLLIRCVLIMHYHLVRDFAARKDEIIEDDSRSLSEVLNDIDVKSHMRQWNELDDIWVEMAYRAPHSAIPTIEDVIVEKTAIFKKYTRIRRKFVKLMNIYVVNNRMWSERDRNDIKNALRDKMYELSVNDRNDLESAFRTLMEY